MANVKAFVLCNTRAGAGFRVLAKLKEVPGVISAHACWGRPDIFLFCEAKGLRELSSLVFDAVQRADGIESTETHIVADET
jgi:DNA-binding Lrp family transcriptional regulator